MGAIAVVAVLVVIPILPIEGNYQIRVVLSGSMEPTIKTGSIVVVRPDASYAVGDVITFTNRFFRNQNGQIIPVTHRIIEVKNDNGYKTFVTKGDANDDADQNPIRDTNILGKEIVTIPYLGYAVETARQPYGFLALILIPAAIIVWDHGKKIWIEVRKIKNKNSEIA